MDLNDKKTLVIGLARTGIALCRFLAERGAKVTVTDMASPASLAEPRREIAGLGITEELGVARPRWQGYDLIIPSPGVPPELGWLKAALCREDLVAQDARRQKFCSKCPAD